VIKPIIVKRESTKNKTKSIFKNNAIWGELGIGAQLEMFQNKAF